MIELSHAIMLSAGWKRRLIAMACGACGALALSPVDFAPAMIVPMVASVWLIDGSARGKSGWSVFKAENRQSLLEAAGSGWWLGFGYFLAGLWWLGSAFLVEADKFIWALPLAVIGLPAGLAFFTASGFFLARILWSPGFARVFALALGLGASEWLRGYILTGFPWNSFGMALGGNLVLGQMASIVGLYGLTFIAVALFAAPATLADVSQNSGSRRGIGGLARSPCGLALIAAIGLVAFGLIRLGGGKTEFEPGVWLRIMQPNLAQDDKFRAENKERILSHYLALSDRATSPRTSGITDVTHLIWPESAFPFILSQDAQSLARIGSLLGDKTILLTGAARMDADRRARRLPGESAAIYHNSIHVIGKGGIILDTYDKVHLVPFGEYLPFGAWLEKFGIRHLVPVPGGFEPGVFRKLLSVPGLPALAPLICYEIAFPGEVSPNDGKSERPGLLLNLTNDGWFGRTSGPYQHMSHARLRSIEEGLPLIRAANTGISAIIDPYGRVLQQLPLGVEGLLDGALPRRASATFFSTNPYFGPCTLLLMMLAGAMIGIWRSAGRRE